MLYYLLAISTVRLILRKNKNVQSTYLKGSFGKKYFLPVVSDLDFFLVGNANYETRKEIENIFGLINLIFPVVKDFDFHSEDTFKLLRSYGGLKYLDAHEWDLLFGEKLAFSYRYNPRKFQIDLVHEVYFQFEWLFKNIKKRKIGCQFQTIKLHRQYEKVQDLLNYANHFEKTKFYIPRKKHEFNLRWCDYSNEYIVSMFNSLIEHNSFFKNNKRIYFHEFRDRDFELILKEKFYTEKVEVIDNKPFFISDKEIYLTYTNLKLFYYMGSIDSFLLYDWIDKHCSPLSSKYIELGYYCRLMERRWNSKHDQSYYVTQFDRSNQLMYEIESFIRFEDFSPTNFSKKNIFLSVSEGENLPTSETASESFLEFHVSLSTKKFNSDDKGACLLQITQAETDNVLDQTNSLLNIGIDWIYGSEVIIIGTLQGINVSPENLEEYLPELGENNFLNVKSDCENFSLWLASSWLWNSILPIDPFDSSVNLDELLFYQVSGGLKRESKQDYTKLNISSHKYEIIERNLYLNTIKDGKILEQKNRNFSKLLPLLTRPVLSKSTLGLISIENELCAEWELLKKLFLYEVEDPYYRLEILASFIKSAQSSNLLFDFSTINLSTCLYWHLYGPVIMLAEEKDMIQFRTSKDVTDNLCTLNRSINSENQFIFYHYKFENNAFDERVHLIVGDNNVQLSWAGEQIYSIQFFIYKPALQEKDFLQFKLNLLSEKSYQLTTVNSESYQDFKDEQFDFYKTLEDVEYCNQIYLESIHAGFYKIVIHFVSNVSGKFFLTDKQYYCRFQEFSVRDHDTCVIYHFLPDHVSDLILHSELQESYSSGVKIIMMKLKDNLL